VRGAEPVAELEQHPLGALAADAGDADEGGLVSRGDAPAQLVGLEDGQHGQRQPWPDPADGLQQLEDVALVVGLEAEQGEGVLADHERRGQPDGGTHAQAGEGAGRGPDQQAHPADGDDGAVQPGRQHLTADLGEHGTSRDGPVRTTGAAPRARGPRG
jgi:hypothetical protein